MENARDPGAGLDDCALFDKFPSNFMIGMGLPEISDGMSSSRFLRTRKKKEQKRRLGEK